MKEKKIIDIIKKKIYQYDYNYYNLNKSIISDYEYDLLFNQLKKIEKKYPHLITADSPTQKVSGGYSEQFNKFQHPTKMLSLNNIFSTQDVINFCNKINNIYKKDLFYICEPKIDGVAINIIYKNGKLIKCLTRGDGSIGEDITNNIKKIKSVPLQLKNNFPSFLEVRGEIYITLDNFLKLQEKKEKKFSNPRNLVSGSIRHINSNIINERNIDIIFHGIGKTSNNSIFNDNYHNNIKKLETLGLKINKLFLLSNKIEEIINFINFIQHKRTSLEYQIDGLVIKINSMLLQKNIGENNKFPKWAIAYKYPSKKAVTKIINVRFQVGKTGVITPIAVVNPILIDGIIIKNVTLHNFYDIKKQNIKINSYVIVIRSGDVIPKIIKVIKKKENIIYEKDIIIPIYCPSCKTKTIKKDQNIYCNSIKCKEKKLRQFTNFCSKDGFNIVGLGEKILKKLLEYKIINSYTDIFLLNENSLIKIPGFKKKLSYNIISSIQKSIFLYKKNFLFSLGIKNIGIINADILANSIINIKDLANITYKELSYIKYFGSVIKNNIIEFFSIKENKKIFNELIDIIVFKKEKNFYKDYNLNKNKKILAITGKFLDTRTILKKKLFKKGYILINNINKKTNFLLIGKNPGNKKILFAQKNKIKILFEKDI